MKTYLKKLSNRIAETNSQLCVGLDPRPDLIDGDIFDFLKKVIDETTPYTAAFKPNSAYFEAMGSAGIVLMENILTYIPNDIPVVLDVKRSDIGETQNYYAKACFEHWQVDAVTLNPYLGFDSIEPFAQHAGKGIYLLGVTSNAGAADYQMQILANGQHVFEQTIALIERAAALPAEIGLVAGLTNLAPEVLQRIPDVPLLIPGLGAQGGDLSQLQQNKRQAPNLINVSRGILYKNPEQSFAEKAQAFQADIAALTTS